MAAATIVVAALVPLRSWGAAALDASFDYFYIEANEGNSSGGHAAVRFGPWVYHFQNRDGLLVLLREPVDEFLYSYALLSNRTIHSSRIAVSADTWNLIERNLERRRRAQTAQLEVLASLRRDRRLLEAWRDGAEATWVSGLGYFRRDIRVEADRSSNLVALGEQIGRVHGAAFLAARRASILEQLDQLYRDDPAGWRVDPPTSPYDSPTFSRPYSRRFADLAAGLAALEVLDQARSLEPDSVRTPNGEEFRLREGEARTLSGYARALEQQLIELVASRRADWGGAFLIGAARLLALERSLERDRWVGLDSFPATGHSLSNRMLVRRSDITPMMLAETRQQFDDFRRYLAKQQQVSELEWERTEERFNRYVELRRGLFDGGDVRVARGHLVPSRGRASLPLPAGRSPNDLDLADGLRRVQRRVSEYEDRLDGLYRYGLITRNCVSAIFETLNDSFSNSPHTAEAELGGWIDGVNSLTFIPFVSAARVNQRYRVTENRTIDSFRQARLREVRDRESGFWVELRESNTFTSTTYQRAERDSFFVFFTEDAPLLRPLFGTVNLAAALGESLWGFARLPFDRGATLMSGLKGAFMSLPELAFANIRKGSNDWIAKAVRDVPLDTRVVSEARAAPAQ